MVVMLPFILCLPPSLAAFPPVPPPNVQLGHNISGAIIFFSYIFAALYFIRYIVLSISENPAHVPTSSKARYGEISRFYREPSRQTTWKWHHGALTTFCALALASFATLSWNMLNFLIVSYLDWSAKHGVSMPSGLPNLLQLRQHIRYVLLWTTGSDLFQTFAEDLVSDPVQWKLVRLALIYSYTWNSWMSTLGHEADIPNLWAYFALDQILPVSFAQNLFCVALIRASKSPSHESKTVSTQDTSFSVRFLSLFCYCAILYWIPTTIKTAWFFPTLFTLRALLLIPYIIDRFIFQRQKYTLSRMRSTTTSFNYSLVALSIAALGGISVSEVRTSLQIPSPSLNINYAAAALSNDMVLGFTSGLAVFLLAKR